MKKVFNVPIAFFTAFVEHLDSEKHSLHHRMFFGIIVMASGVLVSGVLSEIFPHVRLICEGAGGILHGAGCMPIFEAISKRASGLKG